MFYKVIKDGKIIDVLDRLVYLKYQKKHDRMIFCDIEEAQAIFSSDGKSIWHEETLYDIPVSGYDTVSLEEIDKYEYERLKLLHCMTSEEIVEQVILRLVNSDFCLGSFTEALKELYDSQAISKEKIIELYNAGRITDVQKNFIL